MSEIQAAAGTSSAEDRRHQEKKWYRIFPEEVRKLIEDDKKEWEVKRGDVENKKEWLMVLATLAVSITYSAGLNPPGGFWQDDSNGHAAGTPVLQSTNRARYLTFYYFNAMSLVTSLVIILLLNQNINVQALVYTTLFDVMGLVVAYVAGSTNDMMSSIGVIIIAGAIFIYFARRILLTVFLITVYGFLAGLMFIPFVCVAPVAYCFCVRTIRKALGGQ